MNTFFSVGALKNVFQHLPEKLAASAGVVALAEAMGVQLQLFIIFLMLEVLDVFTRWIALSCRLWHDMYPQTPGTVWQYVKFIRQAHCWRYIKSEAMRNQFISKIGTYTIILLVAAFGDIAMTVAGGRAMILTVIVAILVFTETLSCLENLNECGVSVAQELIAIIKKRKEQIK